MEGFRLSTLTCKLWGRDWESHVTDGENKAQSLSRSLNVVEPGFGPDSKANTLNLYPQLTQDKIFLSDLLRCFISSWHFTDLFLFLQMEISLLFSFSAESKDDTCYPMLPSSLAPQPTEDESWNFLLYNCSKLPGLIAPGRRSPRPIRVFDATRACQGCRGIC